MVSLQLRMALLLAALFGIVYMVIVMVGASMGVYNFYFYLMLAFIMMAVQYMIGPKIVEWTMRVRYVKREEMPQLYALVENMARQAKIPMPRVGL